MTLVGQQFGPIGHFEPRQVVLDVVVEAGSGRCPALVDGQLLTLVLVFADQVTDHLRLPSRPVTPTPYARAVERPVFAGVLVVGLIGDVGRGRAAGEPVLAGEGQPEVERHLFERVVAAHAGRQWFSTRGTDSRRHQLLATPLAEEVCVRALEYRRRDIVEANATLEVSEQLA